MTREEKNNFIDGVAFEVDALRGENYLDLEIKVSSPIIAQAILESGWGTSKLAENAFNFFGLTAAGDYSGPKYFVSTNEYADGKLVEVIRPFRSFYSFNDGIRGYFDFIARPYYKNLRGISDFETYIDNIIRDGYNSSPGYKEKLLTLIKENKLERFDVLFETRAKEISLGRYGNGSERIENLTSLGYTDRERELLQTKVDALVNQEVLRIAGKELSAFCERGKSILASEKNPISTIDSLAEITETFAEEVEKLQKSLKR